MAKDHDLAEFGAYLFPKRPEPVIKKKTPLEEQVKDLKKQVRSLEDRIELLEVDKDMWVHLLEGMFDTLVRVTTPDKVTQSDVKYRRARFLECYRNKSWREILAEDEKG